MQLIVNAHAFGKDGAAGAERVLKHATQALLASAEADEAADLAARALVQGSDALGEILSKIY